MAENDVQGSRRTALKPANDVLLYIGGNLGVGKHDFRDDEIKFKKLDSTAFILLLRMSRRPLPISRLT